MPSLDTFVLPDAPIDGGAPLRNLSPKITFGDSYLEARPESDVEARHSVSIRLIATSNAFEVAVASPVPFAGVSAPRACLRGVVWLDFLDGYAFSLSRVLQGMPEEAVWDSVDLPGAPTALLALALSKPLDGNVGVELLGEPNDLVGYLPHPRPDVVPLPSAEPPEPEPRLAPGDRVSVSPELSPTPLKAELPGGDVL